MIWTKKGGMLYKAVANKGGSHILQDSFRHKHTENEAREAREVEHGFRKHVMGSNLKLKRSRVF